jgi:integrase
MRITGINRVRAKGKLYLYDRKTGTPLECDPTDPVAIAAELKKIRGEEEEAKDGTLGGLIADYRKSPEFKQLAERTRSDYQKVFDHLKPLRSMDIEQFNRSKFILKLRNKIFTKRRRRFANYFVQVARLLLAWGLPHEWTKTNAAAAVPLIKRPKGMARANRPWTEQEREIVLARAPAQLKQPIALGIYVAPREQDVIAFPRSRYNGTHIHFTALKNGRDLWLRAHPRLRAVLDAAPKDATIFCLNSRGKSWTESGFRSTFFKFIGVLEKEGVIGPDLTFHGLRHTIGDELADAGCDTRDIAAVLGITEKQAEHYSRGGDRRRRANAALLKLERKRK